MLSSTISRLNFLSNPSIRHPLLTLSTFKPRKQRLWNPPVYAHSGISLNSRVSSSLPIQAPASEEDLVVLGIETSCDDTAAAVVRGNGEILSQVISSQAELLAQYGGVAPKMAEEAHSLVIDQVVEQALDEANLTADNLSAVAVTIGPGLGLCLRVGVQKAHKLAGAFNLPIVGIHHMEAHALVARIIERDLQFPFLALLISGGHNLLVLARDLGHYIQLGTTIDDAIGEAYDKTAKWLALDLRRSGGPALEELAKLGNAQAVKFSTPMKQHKDCNFSYAGLKTQVRLAIESRNINAEIPISSASDQDRSSRADIAASFQVLLMFSQLIPRLYVLSLIVLMMQRVAVLHLEEKCDRAISWARRIEPSIKHLVVSGGVASNKYVRARLEAVAEKSNLKLVCPPPSLCTDNGVMVAWTGIEHFRMGRFDPPPPRDKPEDFKYDIRARWPLGEEYAEGRSEARSRRTARIHPSLTSIIQGSTQHQQAIQ
ncbi:Probable tRNA N6-adenosine threonylcarbamoyltransferase, mitochondrial [Linum grandiflorum]